jgi:hypothetical protein
MKKMTMSTILAAGFVVVSPLSTAPPTSAATDNTAEQPDDPIVESVRRDLEDSGMPASTPQPDNSDAERYRQVLEQLRLPAVDKQPDGSNSQQDPQ